MRAYILGFIIAAFFLWISHPTITFIESFLKAIVEVIGEQWRLRKILRWKIKTIPDIKPESQGPYR